MFCGPWTLMFPLVTLRETSCTLSSWCTFIDIEINRCITPSIGILKGCENNDCDDTQYLVCLALQVMKDPFTIEGDSTVQQ